MKKLLRCVFATVLLYAAVAGLQAQNFPELSSMDKNDRLFIQISDDIQSFYRWQAGNGVPPQLSIYRYSVRIGDTLFSLSARLNLPQASIATLNRLDHPDLPDPGSYILIPNIPGMFIPSNPVSDLERMLSNRISDEGSIELSEEFRLPGKNGSTEAWSFILAGDFTGIERRAFLQVLMRDPLPEGYVSSSYGIRTSPFTGRSQFHYGIDLVAVEGANVRSAAEGVVIDVGLDEIYGNYLTIEHPGGYRTLYAHLKQVFVSLDSDIRSGEIIAAVGSSGLSTGPHLHFEIMYLGRNRDPQRYFRRQE